MGQEVLKALTPQEGFQIVAAVDRHEIGRPARELVGPNGPDLVIEDRLGPALDRSPADVIVDFSHHSVAPTHAETAAKRGASFVIGCTGLGNDDIAMLRGTCTEFKVSGMYVPNFAIGAVLMMKFAELAARWLPDAEIIELHHDRKEDAPSGTAMLTAEKIQAARTSAPRKLPKPFFKVEGARGGLAHEVPVHSIRLPGLLAHQEVIFGGPGETLTIRHDSLDRAGFMNGVRLAARQVRSLDGLVIGLDKILF
jgi:4-hydroxy-tetrahydrodipicolinate reductase